MIRHIIFTVNECIDTEEWCKQKPSCEGEEVKEKCPKLCKICEGK